MYERKIALDLECGVHLTREVLAGKWKVALLYYLHQGVRRPGQLQKRMPGATRRVLHLQLNQLEAQGLVTKTVFAELPPKVEYSLTAFGETLLPVIEVLGQWGETHRQQLHGTLAAASAGEVEAAAN